jgi:hypothetical protein
MFSILRMRRWPPYAAGALLGALSWFAFATTGKLLGVSTALVKTTAMAEQAVVPGHVAANPYFAKTGTKIDWEWMLVLGIALGAWTAGRLAGAEERKEPPALWQSRFGASRRKRYAAAFAGGGLVMYGARMAGGCTSGHGISGSLQLAVSSWTFFLTIFAAAVAVSALLYGRGANDAR